MGWPVFGSVSATSSNRFSVSLAASQRHPLSPGQPVARDPRDYVLPTSLRLSGNANHLYMLASGLSARNKESNLSGSRWPAIPSPLRTVAKFSTRRLESVALLRVIQDIQTENVDFLATAPTLATSGLMPFGELSQWIDQLVDFLDTSHCTLYDLLKSRHGPVQVGGSRRKRLPMSFKSPTVGLPRTSGSSIRQARQPSSRSKRKTSTVERSASNGHRSFFRLGGPESWP